MNQDELKSLHKCRQVATARLKDGMSVVIDATNPKVKEMREQRAVGR